MSSEKEKNPAIRFRGFDDAWEQRKFSNIVNRVSKQSNDPNLPKVEFEDIVSGEGRLNKNVSSKFDSRKGTVFESEFILYGKLRPYLKNWLFPDFKGIALGDFWVFESNNSSPVYNFYLIQSDKYQTIANLSSGTKMPRSDWKTVSETVFGIPHSIEEQEKVGIFFKVLDETIALHQRQLDNYKELKKGMLQKMFPQDGEKVPEVRFNGFTEEWEQSKLENIFEKIRNAFVGTATPYYVENGHFYLESNNVKDGKINRNSEIFINDEFYEKQRDKWLHTNDLVMVQSGHVGHTAVIPKELDGTAAHALIMFQNYKVKSNPYFLNYQFQTSDAKKKLDNITTGNTIKHILASEMKKFEIILPNFEEQTKIGSLFFQIDNTIVLHQQKITDYQQIKKAMLQQMFV